MRVLIWGSRNLTAKHLGAMRSVARHALLAECPPLDEWLEVGDDPTHAMKPLPDSEPLQLCNGDGPPGKHRGAIGADKLALLACALEWPDRRRVKWFPPEQKMRPDGSEETWAEAAYRRDVEMAESKPDRAYCVHTDLDASRGSIHTARRLTELGIRFFYVKVSPAGAILDVERR